MKKALTNFIFLFSLSFMGLPSLANDGVHNSENENKETKISSDIDYTREVTCSVGASFIAYKEIKFQPPKLQSNTGERVEISRRSITTCISTSDVRDLILKLASEKSETNNTEINVGGKKIK